MLITLFAVIIGVCTAQKVRILFVLEFRLIKHLLFPCETYNTFVKYLRLARFCLRIRSKSFRVAFLQIKALFWKRYVILFL